MFQRILIPLDGSARAEQALPVAARLARASGGSLVLLRVVTSPLDFAWFSMEEPGMITSVIEDDVARATGYVAALAQTQRSQGSETSIEVVPGEPAQTILSIARFSRADLIVMCSHGQAGLKRWLLGSVAQKVARHCSLPVLVVREEATLPTEQPLRVLAPLDGSPLAEASLSSALELCRALAAPAGAQLHLVRVLPLPPVELQMQPSQVAISPGGTQVQLGTTIPEEDSERREVMEATRALVVSEAASSLRVLAEGLQARAGLDVPPIPIQVTTTVVVHPDVAGTLLTLAESGTEHREVVAGTAFTGADVIAMATHGRGGLGRWMVGSVTERVLEASHLPLLIVRPEEAGQQEQEEARRHHQRAAEG